jgi:hypothetical protein
LQVAGVGLNGISNEIGGCDGRWIAEIYFRGHWQQAPGNWQQVVERDKR